MNHKATYLYLILSIICSASLYAVNPSVFENDAHELFIIRNDTCVIIRPYRAGLHDNISWSPLCAVGILQPESTDDDCRDRIFRLKRLIDPVTTANNFVANYTLPDNEPDSVTINLIFPNLPLPSEFITYNPLQIAVSVNGQLPVIVTDNKASFKLKDYKPSNYMSSRPELISIEIYPLVEIWMPSCDFKFDGAPYYLTLIPFMCGHNVDVTFPFIDLNSLTLYTISNDFIFIVNDTIYWKNRKFSKLTGNTSEYEKYLDPANWPDYHSQVVIIIDGKLMPLD